MTSTFPTWFKRPEMLEKTLNGFLALQVKIFSLEIILVDNAGDPDTEKIVNIFTGKLPLKYLVVTKRGKNNALNRAIPEAEGKLFIFTDDDVLVISSEQESFGLTAIEALAVETPVISTRYGGPEELLEEDVTGFRR